MSRYGILLLILIAVVFIMAQGACYMDDMGCNGRESEVYEPAVDLDDDDDIDDDDDNDSDDDDDDTGDDDDDDDDHECGDPVSVTQWPTNGYFLRMWAAGEQFHLSVTSALAMTHIESWLSSKPDPTTLGIPGGPIELENTFNPGYSYQLVSSGVEFNSMWMEVCDATPCYVEMDSAEWFSSPTTWCPWSATVTIMWDCDGGDGTSCGTPVFP